MTLLFPVYLQAPGPRLFILSLSTRTSLLRIHNQAEIMLTLRLIVVHVLLISFLQVISGTSSEGVHSLTARGCAEACGDRSKPLACVRCLVAADIDGEDEPCQESCQDSESGACEECLEEAFNPEICTQYREAMAGAFKFTEICDNILRRKHSTQDKDKRKNIKTSEFVGKRAGIGPSEFVGKRGGIGPSEFVGKRGGIGPSEFVGKRGGIGPSEFVGKRGGIGPSEFVGKRGGIGPSEFVGKRGGIGPSEFVGKRGGIGPSEFVGKRGGIGPSEFVGKRAGIGPSEFVGKRGDILPNEFVG